VLSSACLFLESVSGYTSKCSSRPTLILTTTQRGCRLAGTELAATWHQSIFIRVTRVNFNNGFTVNDSTIKSVLLLLSLFLMCLHVDG